jgi:hypothetical protein
VATANTPEARAQMVPSTSPTLAFSAKGGWHRLNAFPTLAFSAKGAQKVGGTDHERWVAPIECYSRVSGNQRSRKVGGTD